MTGKPDTDIRHQLIALLTARRPFDPGKYRKSYPRNPSDERAWHRADEQERRRMLKDCGWL